MKVAIIGAGIAGLATARTLKTAGIESVVFEKSRGLGGRVNTRTTQGYVFDTGATSVAPRGKAIEKVLLQELPQEGLIKVEKPIFVHTGLRVSRGDQSRATDRYVYQSGLQQLATNLARDLQVLFNTEIEEVIRDGNKYIVKEEIFDALVLTAPIPQTSQLLWSMSENRPLANAAYRSCLSVMLGFSQPNPDLHYHAILEPEQVHPMTWLSIESVKSPGRADADKCAMVMQMSARFSQENYQKSDAWIIDTALQFTRSLYGESFHQAEIAMVKKWKYSQPTGLGKFEAVNIPGSTLLIASDGITGGRIEEAYECGVKVANLLIDIQ